MEKPQILPAQRAEEGVSSLVLDRESEEGMGSPAVTCSNCHRYLQSDSNTQIGKLPPKLRPPV